MSKNLMREDFVPEERGSEEKKFKRIFSLKSMGQQVLTFGLFSFLLLGLLKELFTGPSYNESDISRGRLEAVGLARDGMLEQSLQQLEVLRNVAPENQALLWDYLVVLQWAEKNVAALSFLSVETIDDLPFYVINAMVKSALALNNYPVLIKLYHTGLNKADDVAAFVLPISQGLIAQGQFQTTDDLLKAALAVSPPSIALKLEMARLYHAQAQPRSQAMLDSLINEAPDNTNVQKLWIDSIVRQARQGQLADAILRFEEAVSLFPQLATHYVDYAVLLAWAGENEAVYLSYEKILAQQTNGDALAPYALEAFAKSFRESGRFALAEKLYRQLLAIKPGDLDATLGLALTLIELNQLSAALGFLEPLAKEYPEHRDIQQGLAFAYENNRQPVAAARQYSHLFTIYGEEDLASDWLQNAVKASKKHGVATVKSQFERMLANPEENQRVLNEYVLILIQHGKTTEAERWSSYLDLEQSPAYVIEALAKLARNQNKFKKAQRLYKTGYRHYPKNIQMPIGLGLTMTEARQEEPSHRVLSWLNNKYPDNVQILEALHYHYQVFNRPGKEILVLKRLAEMTQDNEHYVDKWAGQSMKMVDDHNRDYFINQFEMMLSRFPRHDKLRYDYLSLMAQQGQYVRLMAEVNSMNVNNAPAYLLEMLGFVARQVGDIAHADYFYQIGVQRYPEQSVFSVGLALAAIDAGHVKKGKLRLDQTKSRFGESKDLLFAYAYACEQMENYVGVVNYYGKILEKWPNNEYAYR